MNPHTWLLLRLALCLPLMFEFAAADTPSDPADVVEQTITANEDGAVVFTQKIAASFDQIDATQSSAFQHIDRELDARPDLNPANVQVFVVANGRQTEGLAAAARELAARYSAEQARTIVDPLADHIATDTVIEHGTATGPAKTTRLLFGLLSWGIGTATRYAVIAERVENQYLAITASMFTAAPDYFFTYYSNGYNKYAVDKGWFRITHQEGSRSDYYGKKILLVNVPYFYLLAVSNYVVGVEDVDLTLKTALYTSVAYVLSQLPWNELIRHMALDARKNPTAKKQNLLYFVPTFVGTVTGITAVATTLRPEWAMIGTYTYSVVFSSGVAAWTADRCAAFFSSKK